MRIPSGDTTKYMNFVAVDATDLKTRETGLTTFTVYRSRNGATPVAMTTPTVSELNATNTPGVYALLVDEDTTIGVGNDSEEMVFHITHAGMEPVTRTIEIYRRAVTSGNTLDVTATGAGGIDWGNIENKTTANDLSGTDIQLVDTTTTNTDMRGTDSAATAASVAALNDFDPAADTVATVTTVTNQVSADMTAISGDATAADNIEAMYDGTGYTNDVAPATQVQVGSLSTGSASISVAATGATVDVGTQTLTYTATQQLDGSFHEIDDVIGQIDVTYAFNVGGAGVGSEITVAGRMFGNGDDLGVFVYNWLTSQWDQIGMFEGKTSSAVETNTYNLLVAHTGTGASAGQVDLRFYTASGLNSATLFIDQLYLSYAVVSQTVGYALGQVWINTDAANTGTELYVDGVADHPVSTLAAAKTIADNLGMKDFHVTSNSTITLMANLVGYNLYGIGFTLNTAGYDCSYTHFSNAAPVNGVVLSTTGHVDILDSVVETITVNESYFENCSFTNNTVTLGAVASDVKFINCRSVVAGSGTPVIDFGTSAGIDHNVTFSDWQNGLEIANFNANVTTADLMSLSGTGQLIIGATCAGGTINLRGQWRITDNAGGAVAIVYDGVAQNIIDIETDVATAQADLDLMVGADGTTLATLQPNYAPAKATDIVSGGAIDTTGGAVDTVTSNTDMRGTDNAATGAALATAQADLDIITGSDGTTLATLQPNYAPAKATDIVSGGAIDTTGGAVDTVTTVTDQLSATTIADSILNRDMSAVSDTNSRSPLNALRFIRNKWQVVGTTLTVNKEDDTTSAWTATITTDASADPITGNDPA